MNKMIAAVAATLLTVAGSAWAADDAAPAQGGMDMEMGGGASAFIKADTNGDGTVDKAEAKAAGLSANFAKADANKDGKLDQSEFSALEIQK